MPPYPMGGYGDPGHAAPPAGFQVGYHAGPDQPILYQPGPAVSPSHQGKHIVKYVSKCSSLVKIFQLTSIFKCRCSLRMNYKWFY